MGPPGPVSSAKDQQQKGTFYLLPHGGDRPLVLYSQHCRASFQVFDALAFVEGTPGGAGLCALTSLLMGVWGQGSRIMDSRKLRRACWFPHLTSNTMVSLGPTAATHYPHSHGLGGARSQTPSRHR